MQQDGLGLIVLVMCSEQNRRAGLRAQVVQCGITGLARRLFHAPPRIGGNVHTARMEFNTRSMGHASASGLPGIRICLQAMMDMQGDKAHTHAGIAPRGARVQQRCGVTTA